MWQPNLSNSQENTGNQFTPGDTEAIEYESNMNLISDTLIFENFSATSREFREHDVYHRYLQEVQKYDCGENVLFDPNNDPYHKNMESLNISLGITGITENLFERAYRNLKYFFDNKTIYHLIIHEFKSRGYTSKPEITKCIDQFEVFFSHASKCEILNNIVLRMSAVVPSTTKDEDPGKLVDRMSAFGEVSIEKTKNILHHWFVYGSHGYSEARFLVQQMFTTNKPGFEQGTLASSIAKLIEEIDYNKSFKQWIWPKKRPVLEIDTLKLPGRVSKNTIERVGQDNSATKEGEFFYYIHPRLAEDWLSRNFKAVSLEVLQVGFRIVHAPDLKPLIEAEIKKLQSVKEMLTEKEELKKKVDLLALRINLQKQFEEQIGVINFIKKEVSGMAKIRSFQAFNEELSKLLQRISKLTMTSDFYLDLISDVSKSLVNCGREIGTAKKVKNEDGNLAQLQHEALSFTICALYEHSKLFYLDLTAIGKLRTTLIDNLQPILKNDSDRAHLSQLLDRNWGAEDKKVLEIGKTDCKLLNVEIEKLMNRIQSIENKLASYIEEHFPK